MVRKSILAKRLLLAWALVVSLAIGPALVVGMSAAHAATGCGSASSDCPCDKGGCVSLAKCVSHCLQMVGNATADRQPAKLVRAVPAPTPDSYGHSIDQAPGLDPPRT